MTACCMTTLSLACLLSLSIDRWKSLTIKKPLETRESACVEVMTTLHGSTPSPWRRVEGCVPSEGGFTVTDLNSPLWIRVGGRLTRVSDQSDQRSNQRDMDSQIVTVDLFTATMASIQEAIANLVIPQAIPFTLHSQIEVAPPPVTLPISTSEDPHTLLPTKFRMPEIERYTGIGCPHIHLRLYSTVMRAHRLDEAQMVMLFPMSLSGAAQRWRELEALRQRPEKSVISFISRWREKISQIIDRPSEKDQISMIMRSLQPRFATLDGISPY
ncbi:hypothetical protein CK203_112176 [Vitis vinifera]|uniref:Retrotransposon gag domain-containing protein n=1 Tax=Vitis vinifera TaxID=29760 RepID=A0A438D375_VITVI|nr:hypothetical protein CK203_112176 [Vitis vinifera]